MTASSSAVEVPCRSCGKPLHPATLDFGAQPLANRFLLDRSERQFTHPLALGVCTSCGLVQIIDPPLASEVAPRFSWIMYNEPEGHLDQLTDLIVAMGMKSSPKTVAGVSYKDDTTLERLSNRGIEHVWRVTPAELGLNAAKVEIETVQERITPVTCEKIVNQRGQVDILMVRHVLEHAHQIDTFLAGLKLLVKPDGMLIFEVPDCSSVLAKKDYSTVWEEHLLYFTPSNLQNCLEFNGFEVVRIENYPYPLENSLIAFVRPCGEGEERFHTKVDNSGGVDLALDYLNSFPFMKERYRQYFAEYRTSGKKIVLLGAGHLACAFVNLFELQEYIECILDDDPNRQGMFMPGSGLPIKPTNTLDDREIGLCLFSLNPLNEKKVMAQHEAFRSRGGVFKSIFPASCNSLDI